MKFLLDTNVLSELVQKRPSSRVVNKFQAHEGTVAIASVVWHELVYGVSRLPDSRRREQLRSFVWDVVYPSIPILPYDAQAAEWHAQERARLVESGLTPAFVDGQIAGVAVANSLTLVTRDQSDFKNFEGLATESWH